MGVRWGYIAMHGALASVFFFVLQRFGFSQSLETSLIWGAILGLGAVCSHGSKPSAEWDAGSAKGD